MTDRNFKVIKGGLDASLTGTKEFVSAYITDTRLMGVTGLYIHWHLIDTDRTIDFHQFYYFDAEEYGFETYKSIFGSDVAEISLIESALLGGLGGKKKDISEHEARYLVQDYVRANEELSLPLPDGKNEYQFILDEPVTLTLREKSELMKKMCDEVHSVYQVINYFLMRCFGRDYYAAKHLTNGRIDIRIYEDYPISTLCKNTVDLCDEENNVYLCESLIESGGTYHIVISEVQVDALLISSFKRRSSFKISSAEAAMMLSRPEFITVYDILLDDEEVFDSNITEVTSNAMLTLHENGKLFLVFNKNNHHVNKQIFRLNEDIYGMYYVTDYGQLIVASYSIQGIHALEADLRKSSFDHYLVMTAKYEFKEPILYEFIQSDFEDFEDFLEFIKD